MNARCCHTDWSAPSACWALSRERALSKFIPGMRVKEQERNHSGLGSPPAPAFQEARAWYDHSLTRRPPSPVWQGWVSPSLYCRRPGRSKGLGGPRRPAGSRRPGQPHGRVITQSGRSLSLSLCLSVSVSLGTYRDGVCWPIFSTRAPGLVLAHGCWVEVSPAPG